MLSAVEYEQVAHISRLASLGDVARSVAAYEFAQDGECATVAVFVRRGDGGLPDVDVELLGVGNLHLGGLSL